VAALHGDLEQRVTVQADALAWEPSPSPTVWRRRLHRVGPAESGQVTSVVRYDPGSRFPAHDHPDGEEILVLEGVFSDEHGDWPAGTFLLNPEGFRHAPFSRPGCVLFVKLRQAPGRGRLHVAIDTRGADWETGDEPGIELMPLYSQPGFVDRMSLERWAPGASRDTRIEEGTEIFLIDGELEDAGSRYPPSTWLRLPAGQSHRAQSPGGCTCYVKRGGFAYLHPEASPSA
jgi:anti-sigma factor ChrR (cupin superfamily)